MAKLTNELKIGITIIVAITVAIIGYRIMKDYPVFRTATTVFTKFEKVQGLTPGNVVSINGFKIGSVKRMDLTPTDSILVTLNIENNHQIPKGSIVYLKSSGLLGGKHLEVEKSSNTEMIQHEGFITGIYEKGMMDSFTQEGEKLSDDISSSIQGFEALLSNLNKILNDKNKENISGTINNLQNTTQSLNELLIQRKTDIDSMLVSAKNTMQNMDDLTGDNKENIAQLILNLEATSQELETLSNNLNSTTQTLNDVLIKIDEGQGTLGKMINDPSLYNNLDSLTIKLNTLLDDVSDNPGKFLKHMRLIEIF